MPHENDQLENNDPATDATVVDTDTTVEPATDEPEHVADADEIGSDTTTFSRSYVEKLRRESAGYRERANRSDDLAQRLHTSLVAATGRLADAADLPFDAAHLDDAEALAGAIDELLARKPHLASRRLNGDIGQGNRGPSSDAPVNLADMLRARA